MKSTYGMLIKAYKRAPVEQLQIINCDFRDISLGHHIEYVREINFVNLIIEKQKLDMKVKNIELFNFY